MTTTTTFQNSVREAARADLLRAVACWQRNDEESKAAVLATLATYEATGDHDHGRGRIAPGGACPGGDCLVARARALLHGKDAQAEVTTNTTPLRDGSLCVRTAIQLGEACTSIDILARDGSLLCRLNLFDFAEQGGNVDVILDEKRQRGTFLAWSKGAEHLRHTTPEGVSVHAVAIGPHALLRAGAVGPSLDSPHAGANLLPAKPAPTFVAMALGYWGKGATVEEAKANARAVGARPRARGWLVKQMPDGATDVTVDGHGSLTWKGGDGLPLVIEEPTRSKR